MDYDFRRPRYRTPTTKALKPVLAIAATPAPSHAIPSRPTAAKHFDFADGAKAYKHKIMQQSLLRGLFISVCVLAMFIALMTAGGVYVHYKYVGRAIPFTYVGNISIGGLNEQQIKAVLDKRANEITVSLVDGGLVRTVPASQFGATFDTAAVASEATHTKFNPFTYLNKRSFDVPVNVNERWLDGYITANVNTTKTAPQDAKLSIAKDGVKIIPEQLGFRTNVQFVHDRIKLALATMTTPVVNVNTVTLKPSVYSTDLEDDLARANTLVNTAVSLQYGRANIKPTLADKLSWLQIGEAPGTNNVTLGFSKTLIRQYVVDKANRLQAGDTTSAADNTTLVTERGQVIDNIDEATDAIVAALNNGTQLNQKLTSKQGTYNQLVSAN